MKRLIFCLVFFLCVDFVHSQTPWSGWRKKLDASAIPELSTILNDSSGWERNGTRITLVNSGDSVGVGGAPTDKFSVTGNVTITGNLSLSGVFLTDIETQQTVRIYDTDGDTLVFSADGINSANTYAAGKTVIQMKDGATTLFEVDSLGGIGMRGTPSATNFANFNIPDNGRFTITHEETGGTVGAFDVNNLNTGFTGGLVSYRMGASVSSSTPFLTMQKGSNIVWETTSEGNTGVGIASSDYKLHTYRLVNMQAVSASNNIRSESVIDASNGDELHYMSNVLSVLRINTDIDSTLAELDHGISAFDSSPVFTGDGTMNSFSDYLIRGNWYGGTLTNRFCFKALLPAFNGGHITNVYGIYLGSYAAHDSVTNGWGIYQTGSDDNNYFAGNIGIGSNQANRTLTIYKSSADFVISNTDFNKNVTTANQGSDTSAFSIMTPAGKIGLVARDEAGNVMLELQSDMDFGLGTTPSADFVLARTRPDFVITNTAINTNVTPTADTAEDSASFYITYPNGNPNMYLIDSTGSEILSTNDLGKVRLNAMSVGDGWLGILNDNSATSTFITFLHNDGSPAHGETDYLRWYFEDSGSSNVISHEIRTVMDTITANEFDTAFEFQVKEDGVAETGLRVSGRDGVQVEGHRVEEFVETWVTSSLQNPSMATLPANVYIRTINFHVIEGFDSDGTDLISVGDDSDNEGVFQQVDVEAAGVKTLTWGSYRGYNSSSLSLEIYYTNGGTEPSNGKALAVIGFVRVTTEP
jgi:hypothetical protein